MFQYNFQKCMGRESLITCIKNWRPTDKFKLKNESFKWGTDKTFQDKKNVYMLKDSNRDTRTSSKTSFNRFFGSFWEILGCCYISFTAKFEQASSSVECQREKKKLSQQSKYIFKSYNWKL